MAAFTTIAAATVAVGGGAAKGFIAGDAAKVAARESGRLRLEQKQLEEESVARLEQNFFDAVSATTDVYDKQLELGNVMGAQILESVQEGDQRGVAAAAGKIKQVQDATLSQTADKFAQQKLEIDMARAKAGEMSASEIAALQDDRAAAAGLKADALSAKADELKGQSTGAFIDAGVSALQAGVSLAGSIQGKAGDKAAETLSKSKGISIDEARSQVSKYTPREIRQFNRGDITAIDVSGRSNVLGTNNVSEKSVFDTGSVGGTSIGQQVAGVGSTENVNSVGGVGMQAFAEMYKQMLEEQQRNKKRQASNDFNAIKESFQSGNFLGQLDTNMFNYGE